MVIKNGFKAMRYTSLREFLLFLKDKGHDLGTIDLLELRGIITNVRAESFTLCDSSYADSSIHCEISSSAIPHVKESLIEGGEVFVRGKFTSSSEHDRHLVIEDVRLLLPLAQGIPQGFGLPIITADHIPPLRQEVQQPAFVIKQSTFPYETVRKYIWVTIGALLIIFCIRVLNA